MTLNTSTNQIIAQGNGVTTSFSYNFLIPALSDVVVTYTDSLGNAVTVNSSNYVVSGIGNPAGGTITYPVTGSPIPPGSTLTIQRIVPYVQTTSISNQGAFYPNVVEAALDYEMMAIQQLAAKVSGVAPPTSPGYFTPEQFGGSPLITDNQAAFKAMAAAVRAAGGGIINFAQGATYTVYGTLAPVGGNDQLIDLSGCNGVVINFNGAKISTPFHWTSPSVPWVIHLKDAKKISIYDPAIIQTVDTTYNFSQGFLGILIEGASSGIFIYNFVMSGGYCALQCGRGGSYNSTTRARNIGLYGAHFIDIGYGINFIQNGDQLRAERVSTLNCGRSYFPYGVHNHYIEIDSNGASAAEDINISCNPDITFTKYENETADIYLKYSNHNRVTTITDSLIALTFRWNSVSVPPTFGAMRNITIEYDIEAEGAALTLPRMLMTEHQAHVGIDNTPRGYIIENIIVTGVIRGMVNTGTVIDIFNVANGSFAGETINNIIFRDLIIDRDDGTTSTFKIDASVVTANLVMENVYAPNISLNFSNPPAAGVLDASKNVTFLDFLSYSYSGSSGYRHLPNGALEQWGTANAASNGNTTVNFPLTFSSVQWASAVNGVSTSAGAVNVISLTTSSLVINKSASTASGNTYWSARGLS